MMASSNFHHLSIIASFRFLNRALKYLNTANAVSAVISMKKMLVTNEPVFFLHKDIALKQGWVFLQNEKYWPPMLHLHVHFRIHL